MVGLIFLKILSLTTLTSALTWMFVVGHSEPEARDEAGSSQAAVPRVTQQSYLQQSIELSQATLHHLPTTTTNDDDSIDN